MTPNSGWITAFALQNFRLRALTTPDDFLKRFDWADPKPEETQTTGHTLEEVDAIYAAVIAKIPAGATKVLEIGCGDGRFYKALKAAKPALNYRGIDLVPENITEAQTAKGTITVAGVQAGNTVTIGGVLLTAAEAQTPGGLDFDATAEDDTAVATSLVAAINDSGNGLNDIATATVNGSVVTLRAAAIGTGGNNTTLVSSNGTRLAVSGATLTGGESSGLFEIGNAWEYLSEIGVDWDFIVSTVCVLANTDSRNPDGIFDLIDAKAPKGFFILAAANKRLSAFLIREMTAALATSTNVSESYYEGPQTFLDESLLKGVLAPFYIHRESTTAEIPEVSLRYQLVVNGEFNWSLGRQDAQIAVAAGQPIPTTIMGIVASGGLVTGMAEIAVDPLWVAGVEPLNPGREEV